MTDETTVTETGEDTGTQDTGVDTTPTPAPSPEPSSTPAPEVADWRTLIKDENLKKEAERFTDVNGLVQGLVDLKKKVSDGSRVKIPGEGASEEDIGQFRKALGVPETVDGYQIQPPENYEWVDADQEMFDAVAPIAHKYNISNEALQGFIHEYIDTMTGYQHEQLQGIGSQYEASTAELKKDWGKEYDAHVNLANRFAGMMGEDFIELLQTTQVPGVGLLSNHPTVVRALAKMGRKVSEADLSLVSDDSMKKTAMDRIKEIRQKYPAGSAEYKNHAKELQQLYEQVYGAGPVVGSGGRSV